MDDILEKYDQEDYDIIKEIIPFFVQESLQEYNKTFHFFDDDKSDLRFIISERIFWFLIDKKWADQVDLEIICEEVDKYYNIPN